MENSKIFHYTNLLSVELSNEIDTSEIENYFPQTISEKQSDYNSDYTINYNLSQYNYLKNILPSFDLQGKKFPYRSAPAISKNIDGWTLSYFFPNRYSEDYFVAINQGKICIFANKYDSNIVIRILNELIVRKLLEKNYFPIHASAIVNLDDGKTDLFFGGKGSGKSTMFFEKTVNGNYLPLANDVCFVGVENGQAMVYSMTYDITFHKSLLVNNNNDFNIKDDKIRCNPLQFCQFIDKSWIYVAPLKSLNYTALNLSDDFEIQQISAENMHELLLKYGKDRDFTFDDVLNINNLYPNYDYDNLIKHVSLLNSIKGNVIDRNKTKRQIY